MMEKRELTCIGCPMGCHLEILIEFNQITGIKGQACKRGVDYAKKECTNPTRILTTTIEVEGGSPEVVPVKTERDIPKNMLFDCVKELRKVHLKAPIHIGDVIVKDILGTGVNIIATGNSE